ncbi:MAG TPA: hypothetical protein VJN88_05320 [Ktedonobacterales bacterium]|nr:hypothetical protein [Ktedonobacterales bacterium]
MAKRRARSTAAPSARKSRAPNVPSRARDTAGTAFGHGESALPARPTLAALAAGHATELVAPAPASLFATLLELAGAEHGGVQQTLVAWQREQDRLLNRTWRRPGGLARPAGL